MISPQNIATGCSVTELCANEGAVLARTAPHSIALTAMLGGVVAAQQFLVPWIIPR
jgi:lactate permease